MILADAAILLYAYNTDAEQHPRAREWLEASLSAPDLFCFAWQTITAFVRIGTNPRAFPKPLSISEATEIVSGWLARPSVTLLVPGERHWRILSELLIQGQAYGPLVMDAHLAALAIEHGATLCTNDRDFSRFSGLRIVNPLLPTA
jgi:toxin-antitoxin system PIN domain toxin